MDTCVCLSLPCSMKTSALGNIVIKSKTKKHWEQKMIGDFIIPQEYNIMIYLLRTNFYNVTPLTYYHTLSMKTSAFGTLSSPKCTTELPIHLPGRNTFLFSEKVSVLVYLPFKSRCVLTWQCTCPRPPLAPSALRIAVGSSAGCGAWRMTHAGPGFKNKNFKKKVSVLVDLPYLWRMADDTRRAWWKLEKGQCPCI